MSGRLRRGWSVAVAAAAAVAIAACQGSGAASDDRPIYNQAVASLANRDWENAAKGFLEARSRAGSDGELRYRSAFNLGSTYAAQADSVAEEDPQKAVDLLLQSAAWFNDATQMRKGAREPRVNEELVIRRIEQLRDRLTQGQNSLEARLERTIEDQRLLRDGIRELMNRVTAAQAEADPRAFEGEFSELATRERSLLAAAGTVLDLAGQERSEIERKGEQERSDQERTRLIQLQNLEHYLGRARDSLADARRVLRRLHGDKAHRRADAALSELKRAREQLLDPVAVLKGLAQDEAGLLMHTGALEQLSKISLNPTEEAPPRAPAWLTPPHLADRQQTAEQRTDELLARLRAGVSAAEQPPDPTAGQPPAPGQAPDPRQQQVIEAAREAVPFVDAARGQMETAATALLSGDATAAVTAEREALSALARAIERFSGVRDLIELAFAEQNQLVTLLTPPDQTDNPQTAAALADLSTAERARLVLEGVGENRDRLARLKGLLADELAQIEADAQRQAAAAQEAGQAGQPGQAGAGGTGADQDAQKLEAARETYRRAEEARAAALAELERLQALVEAGSARKPSAAPAPLEAATAGRAHIEELRRLFFSIVEHLKELHTAQVNTHDQTATAQSQEGEALALALGPLADFQRTHTGTAQAIAQALQQQADAAGASQDPQAQEQAKALGEAAQETAVAIEGMQGAATLLGEGRDAAQTGSYDLAPALDSQRQAIEHLENAIRALEPPQQDQQQNQDQQNQDQQNQDQQNQDGQQQQQQQPEMSQQQAERQLQEIREREQERERERRQRQQMPPEPVEKDW